MKTAILQTLYQLFKWQHLLFYSLDAGANRDLIEKAAQGTTVSEVSGWRLKRSGIIFSLRNSVCHMHGSCFNSYLHVVRNHFSQPQKEGILLLFFAPYCREITEKKVQQNFSQCQSQNSNPKLMLITEHSTHLLQYIMNVILKSSFEA